MVVSKKISTCWKIVQNEYREMGYATEVKAGGLYCYKSCKNAKGERTIVEEWVKVKSTKNKGAKMLISAP